jgi:hypothetical protein
VVVRGEEGAVEAGALERGRERGRVGVVALAYRDPALREPPGLRDVAHGDGDVPGGDTLQEVADSRAVERAGCSGDDDHERKLLSEWPDRAIDGLWLAAACGPGGLAGQALGMHRAGGVVVLERQLPLGVRPRAGAGIGYAVSSYDFGRHAAAPLGAAGLVRERQPDDGQRRPLGLDFLDRSVS